MIFSPKGVKEPKLADIVEIKVVVPGDISMVDLLGYHDQLLKIIESKFQSTILVRGNEITIKGDAVEVDNVATIFKEMLNIVSHGQQLTPQKVEHTIDITVDGNPITPSSIYSDVIITHRRKVIGPKTAGQKEYIDAIRNHTATFAIGPAGTGKTYLAMAMAVRALKDKTVGRIILTRPAVEAGEKLGFLPGDLQQKVDPYLRPLFDALYEMMDAEHFRHLLDQGTIEIAPLAYMRGRTLNDSFIILDEAQNTSQEQMKMFLTRLGFGSRMVVTGDSTQIDLPSGQHSGLLIIENILRGLNDIAFVHLTSRDVVRHKLVQKIVEAYKRHDEEKGSKR
ncbi:MAG: phosphate starvation-inducible protein PhoH [Candidatus Aquicultor primus]|uniref:PhoH-like protein n=1 Tax=Candidatus Aquicultor primus TaxID=1797195 RepID=A0A1F2UH14_9ACTN|nr:MAG: phosphate starvation-inducible protein PhoH [Candidatus Aquicultor primus]